MPLRWPPVSAPPARSRCSRGRRRPWVRRRGSCRRSQDCTRRAAGWEPDRRPPRQVRPAAPEDIRAGIAQCGCRQQSRVQIALLPVERVRRSHRVVERIPQVRCRVGVGVAQGRQPLNVVVCLWHSRVHVIEDGIGVDDRRAESVAQPGQRLSGRVSFVFGVKSPRNCKYKPRQANTMTISAAGPMVLYGGRFLRRPRLMILRP